MGGAAWISKPPSLLNEESISQGNMRDEIYFLAANSGHFGFNRHHDQKMAVEKQMNKLET